MFKTRQSKYLNIFTICYILLSLIAFVFNWLQSGFGFLMYNITVFSMVGITYIFKAKSPWL